MKINAFKRIEAEAILVPVFQNVSLTCSTLQETLVAPMLEKGVFKAESGELLEVPFIWEGSAKYAVLIGLGKQESIKTEAIRVAFGSAIKKVKGMKAKKAIVDFAVKHDSNLNEMIQAMVEGIGLSQYTFNKYKTEQAKKAASDSSQLELSLNIEEMDLVPVFENLIVETNTLIEATCLARDLVNEPANVIYPQTLAEAVVEAGASYGFEVEVKDESEIDSLQMDAFLAVAEGSENPPRLIVMRIKNNTENPDSILGLVGKGLTYDSGGYALKPAESMVNMKNDMGGSAAVIGAMAAIAKAGLKVNVTAVVAACENMISGGSLKNGDVIGSMAGKTIEIINTDAEGRLTLADAVHYMINEEKATHVLDIATLTGAALGALGQNTAPVLSNNDDFYKQYELAAAKTNEKIWRMPADEEFKKMNQSDIADLKNSGGKFGGTITAGLFIGEFAGETPWIHVDIAGPAWSDSEKPYCTKGGTGYGVRSLYHFAKAFK